MTFSSNSAIDQTPGILSRSDNKIFRGFRSNDTSNIKKLQVIESIFHGHIFLPYCENLFGSYRTGYTQGAILAQNGKKSSELVINLVLISYYAFFLNCKVKPALLSKLVFKSSLDYCCKSLKPKFFLYRDAYSMNDL